MSLGLRVIHQFYFGRNLIRFPSWPERKAVAVPFRGYWLSTILDCTEQIRQSCNDKLMALAIFSGKKGHPTWIKQASCSPLGLLYSLSPSYFGANADPTVYRKRGNQLHQFLRVTQNEAMGGDAIYTFIESQGWAKVFTTRTGGSGEDLEFNRAFIPIRLIIENVFGVLKLTWAILHDIFRHDEKTHNVVWYILGSIHNEDILSKRLVLCGEEFWLWWEEKWKKVTIS